MLRSQVFRKIFSGFMLIAFCAAVIIFQCLSIKNFCGINTEQQALVYQSVYGQLGLLEEESQTTPTNTLEEEDDEFNSDSAFLASKRYGHLTLQFIVLQEHVFWEHHPKIIAPPPQG